MGDDVLSLTVKLNSPRVSPTRDELASGACHEKLAALVHGISELREKASTLEECCEKAHTIHPNSTRILRLCPHYAAGDRYGLAQTGLADLGFADVDAVVAGLVHHLDAYPAISGGMYGS